MKPLVLVALVMLAVAVRSHAEPEARAAQERPSNFVYSQSCPAPFASPSAGFAIPGARDLASLGAPGADGIWIDLSIYNNGFAPGTFVGVGPFAPRNGALEYQWHGLDKGHLHYYRLNALQDGRWIELGRGVFEPINCVGVQATECAIGGAGGGRSSVQFAIAAALTQPGREVIEQWLDLSVFAHPLNPTLDNGYAPGTFIGSGPFPQAGAHYTWTGILPDMRHFYRRNVLHVNIGWAPLPASSFLSLDCRNLPAFDAPG